MFIFVRDREIERRGERGESKEVENIEMHLVYTYFLRLALAVMLPL